MPRPRGRHSRDSSLIIATRTPIELAGRLYSGAGLELQFDERNRPLPGGSQLAEYVRNLFRRQVGVPIDHAAGYEEGRMQAWAEVQGQMRSSLSGFYGSLKGGSE